MNKLVFVAVFTLGISSLLAQDLTSPYAGEESRDIKSLSHEDIVAYLAGHGMGFAKAAELNHYPGPKHVLELSDQLELSPQQRRETQQIYDEMHSAAVSVGKEIVEREKALDAAFAKSEIATGTLAEMVSEIASLQGRLRVVHLKAHLKMKQLLSAHQIAKYDAARGYAGGHGHHKKHH